MRDTAKAHPEVLEVVAERAEERRRRLVVDRGADDICRLPAQPPGLFPELGQVQEVRDPVKEGLHRRRDRVTVDWRSKDQPVEAEHAPHQRLEIVAAVAVRVVVRRDLQCAEVDDLDAEAFGDAVHQRAGVAVTAGAGEECDRGRQDGVATFNPMIPAITRPMLASRSAFAGSLKRTMPRITVPTAPTPTQTL